MKKLFLIVAAVLICTGLFAGGGQQSSSSDGLTTLRVWGNNYRSAFTGGSFTLSEWYEGTLKSRIWDKFNEDLAKIGIKLEMELIMGDQIATAFQTLLASGQFNNYDWVAPPQFTDTAARWNLVNQGLLLPLDTAIQQYSDGTARDYFNTPTGQRIKKLNTLSDGHMYWLVQTDALYYKDQNNIAGEPRGGVIREDWLRQLNLQTPTTLDELFNVLQAFQDRDANMNGIKDEIARISSYQFGQAMSGYFGIGAGRISYIQGDKVLSPWYHERARDYIAFMQRLFNADLLKIVNEGDELPGNRVSFYDQYFNDTYSDITVVVPAGQPNAYYAPLVIQAFPNTPAIVNEQPGINQYLDSGMYSIPARSRNVEKTVKMIDYFHTPEYMILGEYGIEGYTFSINADGSRQRFPINDNNVGYDMQYTSVGSPAPYASWTGIFPRMRKLDKYEDYESMLTAGRARGYTEGFAIKNQYLSDFFDNHKWPTYISENYMSGGMAFPTAAEASRLAEVLADLNTYADELLTGLIIGEKSLNNWNTYMADLRRLGLDDVLAIYQARLDRMK